MAEVRLPNDTSVEIWDGVTLVATADAETTSDSYYVDKGVYGPKYISLVVNFTTPATAGNIVDIQVSQGGVIWHTIRQITDINGERIEFLAPQGFFRLRSTTLGGAPVCDADCVARTIIDRLDIHSVGDTIDGNTEGAVAVFGTAAAPIVQDTAGTTFISCNFRNDATTGTTMGLRVTLDAGGAMQTYTNCINAILNMTAQLRNPFCFYADQNWTETFGVQGWGGVYGAYVAFATGAIATTGRYGGYNMEFAIPAGATHAAGGTPQIAFFCAVISGDATAITSFETAPGNPGRLCLFNLQGFAEGTGRCFSVGGGGAAVAATVRILIGTVYYYVMLSTAEAN